MLFVSLERIHLYVFVSFLSRLYESTESYCCHFEVGVGVGVTPKFYVKFFMLWARHCQVSYPVRGQVLFKRETTYVIVFAFLS